MRVWVANDARSILPGSRTLWDQLISWFDAEWVGDVAFPALAGHVRSEALRRGAPDLIIRNASYWDGGLPCKTVALVQDVFPESSYREMQLRVCREASAVVFNSEWTRAQFPELTDHPRAITIPLPVDFELFRPQPVNPAELGIQAGSICWVGAASAIKGFDALHRLIGATMWPWVVVRKDWVGRASGWRGRAQYFGRVSQVELARIFSACSVLVCTSRAESQHLAGIEAGACGLPVVATDTGIYWGREGGVWGMVGNPNDFPDLLERAMEMKDREAVRSYWMGDGLDEASVKARWLELVEVVNGA